MNALHQVLLRDLQRACWLEFSNPQDQLIACSLEEVRPALLAAEALCAAGAHVAGYVAYEAAPAFDAALRTQPPDRPLLMLGVFDAPRVLDSLPEAFAPGRPADTRVGEAAGVDWRMDGTRAAHASIVQYLRGRIGDGDLYQVNFTCRLQGDGVDARTLFLDMAADAPCAAFLETDEFAVVSASPELFFDLQDRLIRCAPMKGTAARGLESAEDLRLARWLQASAKNRAENLMITDMVRNDLSRIAATGTVRADQLFELVRLSTAWQLVSRIEARTRAGLCDIFAALFPGASVTGAPKVAAMREIARLETSPRGIYTGAIGYSGPGRRAQFNIAIRTAIVESGSGRAVYGVGGGIVWDSQPEEEFEEMQTKSRVLRTSAASRDFELLETLLWRQAHGYWLLDEHLERLLASADYFAVAADRETLEARLQDAARSFDAPGMRVRLLLSRSGAITVESRRIDAVGEAVRSLVLAREPVDSRDLFLYHKTTRRAVYARAERTAPAGMDVLLWNGEGQVTETTIMNVVYRLQGRLYTPPVECGLLPGTFRGVLIREGTVAERILRIDELRSVTELWLVNSVRGWCRGRLQKDAVAAGA